jgi:sulfopyruvate decarboxylase alpha subunit
MPDSSSPQSKSATWPEIAVRVFKAHQIKVVAYVPDKVMNPLLQALQRDDYFTVIAPAREEEAVGIVCGAYMAGMRGIVLMQTSGFATIPNALASLAVLYQIPLVMMVSERGTLGEFQFGQMLVKRVMRPVLDSLGVEHHTITHREDAEFMMDRIIKQAFLTQAPAAMILSPMLTAAR